MTDPTESYLRSIIPVGWMRCSCGERLECPVDCERVLDAKRLSHEYIIDMFEKLAGEIGRAHV